MKLAYIFTMSLVSTIAATVAPNGFRPLGNTIDGSTTHPFDFGSTVQLSDDASRMAIGAVNNDGGAIFLYGRHTPTDAEDFARESNWTPLWEVVDEGLGKSFALSGSGDYLVFRQGSEIHTLHVPSSHMIGIPLTTCPGKALELGTTSSESTFGEAQWLVVSCESFDSNRGKVEVFRLDDLAWVPVITITGEHPKARFGWDLGFFSDHSRIVVAVSSPDFKASTGMVQLFHISPDGNVSPLGSNVVGQAAADKFGLSLALSRVGENPILVVGAPQCSNMRGCVALYKWDRPDLAHPSDWSPFGEALIGDNDGDRFGRAVAISNAGDRFAAGSYHFKTHTGLIKLYERSDDTIAAIGDFEGQAPLNRLGFSIAMNAAGSVLASLRNNKNSNNEKVGSVQVHLEDTPFCGRPTEASNNDMFLSRPVCRAYDGQIAESEAECSAMYSWIDGAHCQWISNLSTAAPSSMPSISRQAPTEVPSASPSSSPSISPSTSPSASPSAVPNQSPSSTPKVSPGSSPSESPSSRSSLRPSSSPNASPSSSPSTEQAEEKTATESSPNLRGSEESGSDGGIQVSWSMTCMVAVLVVGVVVVSRSYFNRDTVRRET